MKHVEVQKQTRVTLSPEARKQLHIQQGDILIEEIRNGQIILTPARVVDARNIWFLAVHWIKGEKEAEQCRSEEPIRPRSMKNFSHFALTWLDSATVMTGNGKSIKC